MDRHAKSGHHQDNVRAKAAQNKPEETVEHGFDLTDANERAAVKSLFQHYYFLVKNNMALHHHNALRRFTILQGNKAFDAMTKDNAKYTSARTQADGLRALASIIHYDVTRRLRKSRFFSSMLDESADIAVREQLVQYARGVDPITGESFSHFIGIQEAKVATGLAIFNACLGMMKDSRLDPQRQCGVGSDGGGAMLGKNKGFGPRMVEAFIWVLKIHCVCHRLGSALSSLASDVFFVFQR